MIGRRLLPQLIAAGHEVTATTRRPEKVGLLGSLGATAAVLDALDAQAVMAAVQAAAPEVVMKQLTDLPQRYEPRNRAMARAHVAAPGGGHPTPSFTWTTPPRLRSAR